MDDKEKIKLLEKQVELLEKIIELQKTVDMQRITSNPIIVEPIYVPPYNPYPNYPGWPYPYTTCGGYAS